MERNINLAEVLDSAAEILGRDRRPLLDRMVDSGCDNLAWYLHEKVVHIKNPEERLDNVPPLKYAYNFCSNGAHVTFVREQLGVRTPDLMVEMDGLARFYLEVRKFRLQAGSSAHPATKIVEAVTSKRAQLPASALGFVAIDNFDINLEPFSHEHITQALRELERAAADNPGGWEKPGGVILSACTPGGVFDASIRVGFPHFVWVNSHSQPPVPERLSTWLSSSLPDGVMFDANADSSPMPTAISR